MSEINKPQDTDDYVYVPCTCPCHDQGMEQEGYWMVHCFPCCDNGWVKIKKDSYEKTG